MTVRRYSDEFKKNALELFKTSGKKLSQLERELGIPHGLLRQWQAKFEIAVPSGKLVLNEVESLMAENKQLRRELEIVTMEREILKKNSGNLQQQPLTARYQVVQRCVTEYPVALTCRVMQVSRSGYYQWCEGKISPRAQQDTAMKQQINQVWQVGRGCYGYRRILAALQQQGITIGHTRVRRLLRQLGLQVKRPKAYTPRTTVTDPNAPPFSNLVQRVFEADAPNQTWLTDMTYIATQEGFLYVAGILDMHWRRIVGLSMDSHMRTELVLRAVDMAAHERCPASGLILHSDRGSQYTSHAYQEALTEGKMRSSMSEVGDCYDNAPMESFWATLKAECATAVFATREMARNTIFDYIFTFYNITRLHSALGYRSPQQFEALSEIVHCPSN